MNLPTFPPTFSACARRINACESAVRSNNGFVQSLVGLALSAQAQTGDPGAGAAYAQQVCAKCHAIDRTGSSPELTAPPFKDVANTPGMTETALTVWLRTSHPTMPNIIVEPADMDNVIAYILSLKD
jgi:mono/diheme cytochrome c family protein